MTTGKAASTAAHSRVPSYIEPPTYAVPPLASTPVTRSPSYDLGSPVTLVPPPLFYEVPKNRLKTYNVGKTARSPGTPKTTPTVRIPHNYGLTVPRAEIPPQTSRVTLAPEFESIPTAKVMKYIERRPQAISTSPNPTYYNRPTTLKPSNYHEPLQPTGANLVETDTNFRIAPTGYINDPRVFIKEKSVPAILTGFQSSDGGIIFMRRKVYRKRKNKRRKVA